MLFNSFEFIIFLLLFFIGYWTISKYSEVKYRNLFILISSYIFYGWWDWRYLILIFASSCIDYFASVKISTSKEKKKKQLYLGLSLISNLGMLLYFKYCNFFIDNFIELTESIGFRANINSLNIILPVGISFYTFQTLSYSIDVYRGNLKPAKDIVSFFAYVSFFPQLVAGPIERATNLLPQFYTKKNFSYSEARSGMQQILWGLFKKVVIADNCASIVNEIFGNYSELGSGTLALGAVLFAFQIYGDFSGYSDIAIGTAKLFNFKLNANFKYPYFSRDIAEFWRRWHISLSTWFRDYLYIPLGGSKGGTWMKVRNTFIIFLVSGFWHGANWTFVFWGFLNALFFLPLLLSNNNRRNLKHAAETTILPSFKEFAQIIFTFGLVTFAWIFFRAKNMTESIGYIKRIIINSDRSIDFDITYLVKLVIPIFVLFTLEWIKRKKDFGLDFESDNSKYIRWGLYSIVLMLIVFVGSFEKSTFIYFQF